MSQTSTKELILICPHCNDLVVIEQINCAIFRHGILKKNGEQIDPHSPKDICDYYVNNNLIYGCGKPFKIITINNISKTEICDYI
jgi:hypothetical protein